MPSRTSAVVAAASRAGFGVALMAAPAYIAERWVGPSGKEPSAVALARAVGIRDIAIGGGGAIALLRRDSSASRWLAAAALCDLGDVIATLMARNSLPADRVRSTLIVAAASGILTGLEATKV